MNSKIKLLITCIVFIISTIGGTLFFISQKINPELIKAETIKIIESSLPGSSVSIGEVTYSLGTDVNLNIKNFDLSHNKKSLFILKQINVDIPLLSILAGGGVIDVEGLNPELTFNQNNGQNNWEAILPKSTPKSVDAEKKQEKHSIQVPGFIENSKLNFKLKDFLLNASVDGNKTNIVLSKFSIKNLNFTKTTVLEVVSSVEYQLNKEQQLSTSVKLVGEIELKKIIEDQKLVSTFVISSKDSIFLNTDKNISLPNFEAKIKTEGKLSQLNSKIELTLGEILRFSSDVILNKSDVSVDKLDGSLNLSSLTDFAKDKANVSLPVKVSSEKGKIFFGGSLLYKGQRLIPNIKVETKDNLLVTYDDIDLNIKLNGSLINENLQIENILGVYQGEVKNSISTKIDINALPKSLKSMSLIQMNTDISNLILKEETLQGLLYSKISPKETNNDQRINEKNKVILPKVNIDVRGKNNKIGSTNFAISSSTKVKGNIIDLEKLEIRLDKGKVLGKAKTTIEDTHNIKTNLSMNLNDIHLKSFKPFLPPFIEGVDGHFFGDLVGEYNLIDNQNMYRFKINTKAKNGYIKNLDLKTIVKQFAEKWKFLKGKEEKLKSISEGFDSLELNMLANEKNNKINKLKLVGNANSSSIDLTGNISMDNSKSKLKGDLYIKEITQDLKKSVGTDKIPVLLKGEGFVLLPSLSYTTERIAGSALKKEVKKQEKKIKKEAEKFLKDKAKDLFKGFKL